MTTTKAVLDLQTDLDQPNTPSSPTDVVNKGYVDSVAGGVEATSAPGGGVKGRATFDEDKGLLVTTGIAEVKVDPTAGVEFNGTGSIRAKIDTAQGIEYSGAGALKAKVDGSSVVFNAGALSVPNATSASGGADKGKATFDEAKGLAVAAGIAEVKVDGLTIGFDGLGRLENIGGAGGGGAIGDVSQRAQFTRDISAVAAPTPVTLGTGIDALSHPDAATTGQRFEAFVPPDYYSGDLDLLLTYSMSTAVGGPNNQVRLTTAAEIVDVSTGAIDVATYPETGQNLMTPTTTDIIRTQVGALSFGSFGPGDTVQFYVKRIGADGDDLHTGAFQIISYEWRYTSVVDSRLVTQTMEFLTNSPPEAPPTPGTIGTEIDTLDYATGVDNSQKGAFIVPENWDGLSDAIIYVTYAMSSAVAATVRLETSGEIANVVSGGIDVVGVQNYDLGTTADTGVHRVAIRSIPATALQIGSHLTTRLIRRVAVGGNHPGNFRLVNISVTFSVVPTSGFTTVTAEEHYLDEFGFKIISTNDVWGDLEYPSFGSTFDHYVRMNSLAAAGRIDVAFTGRLASAQGTVAQTKINILGVGGSPQHRLLLYAEGSGAVPVYDSGVIATPLTPTEYIITAGMMSAQPLVQKRFHVVVEAHIDASEEVKCSLPFVRQE